jgi:hypothetical protein
MVSELVKPEGDDYVVKPNQGIQASDLMYY